MATLDSSIINVSLPTIAKDLKASIPLVGWVVLSYSLVIFSLLMIFGALSEKKGLQFNYRYGFSLFFVGSALSGFALNITFLIIARIIQGVGAAMLISVGPALVTRSFPESERGRGLSIIAMVVSVGLMLGPPLGGFIIALSGWRMIFLVNLPVSLVGLFLAHRFIKDFPILNPEKKISVPGSAALSISLLIIMISTLLYSRSQIGIWPALILMIPAGLLVWVFIYYENNPATSIIGKDFFKNRIFVFSGLAMLCVFIGIISVTVLMPFFLEEIKKFKPEQVGVLLMTIPLTSFFLARLAGYLSDRFPARFIATIGVFFILGGIVRMQYLDVDSSRFEIVISLIFIGIGMALFNTPNTSTIMGSVPKSKLGIASGMLATIRTLGISMGVGITLAIFSFFRNNNQFAASDSVKSFMYGYNSVYKLVLIPIILAAIFSILRGNDQKRVNKQIIE